MNYPPTTNLGEKMKQKLRILFVAIIYLLFVTMISAQSWKCIIYGDTRSYDTAHRGVLQSMMNNTPDYKFIINVGDVVATGSSSSDWETWSNAVNDILGGTGQDQYPPKYMAVPGNHDLVHDAGQTNWSNYLSGQVNQFGNDGAFFTFDYENVRFVMLNTEESMTGEQLTMLNNAIENNPKDWLIAVWHQPVFDFGAKSYRDDIHETWGKIFYQHGCDIFFTGHSHYYVRSKKLQLNGDMNPPLDPDHGTAQIVTGNGGAPPYSVNPNEDGNGYMVESYTNERGYTELEFNGKTLYLRHILSDGTVFDTETYTANPKPVVGPVVGNTSVYSKTLTNDARRAMPFVMPEDGTLTSISMYHEAATSGEMLLAVYDGDTAPENRIAITPATTISTAVGWQTINLENKVYIPAGKKIWLAWVYETNPGVRWQGGIPGRMASTENWSAGMPSSWGSTANQSDWRYSIYAEYIPLPKYDLVVTVSGQGSVTLNPSGGNYSEGTQVTITATANSGYVFDHWSGDLSGSANPVTITVDGNKNIIANFVEQTIVVKQIGITDVKEKVTTSANRRAMPFTMSEDGTITSISMYHESGSGDMILGIYEGSSTAPTNLLSKTPVTAVSSSAGWQTIDLETAVEVSSGSTIWLAWIYETNPGIHYVAGTPGRVDAGVSWSAGMPSSWGSTANESDWRYSIYANYETEAAPVQSASEGMNAVGGMHEEASLPTEFKLHNAYPNPFNPGTNIRFSIPENSRVRIQIFNSLGQLVKTIINGREYNAGTYSFYWNGKNSFNNTVPSGIYFIRMNTEKYTASVKAILLK